jgi:hypothetical protein
VNSLISQRIKVLSDAEREDRLVCVLPGLSDHSLGIGNDRVEEIFYEA